MVNDINRYQNKKIKEKKDKKMNKRKNSRIITKILTILGGIANLAKSTNLLASFPESLNIYKDDTIGFRIHSFVNGTMTKRQVFPQPVIEKSQFEKRIHTFEHPEDQSGGIYCSKGDSVIPMQYALLCQSSKQTGSLTAGRTVVVLQKFEEGMKLINGKEYFIELQTDEKDLKNCDRIEHLKEGVLMVSCYRRANGGDFDAVFYVLEPDSTGGKYTFKISLKKIYEGFVSKDLNKDQSGDFLSNQVYFTKVKTSDEYYRVAIHQVKYPEYKNLKSTDKLMILDYKIASKTASENFKGTWIDGLQTIAFGNDDFIYAQMGGETDRKLQVCQISKAQNNKIECKASLIFDSTPLSVFALNYQYKKDNQKATFFLSGSKEFSRCIYELNSTQTHPIDIAKADCKRLKLNFSPDDITDLLGGDVKVEENDEDVMISYYSKKLQKNTNLAGCLKLSLYNYIAQFTDLRHTQGSYLTPLNSTYYILHRGKLASIHERARGRFYLKAPEGEKIANVYLSAYSPALNEEPIVVTTKVNKIESENAGIEIEKIQEITLFEEDYEGIYPGTNTQTKRILESIKDGDQRVPCHLIGINSKLVKGNNLKIKEINLGYQKPDGTSEYASGKDLEFIKKNKNLFRMMKVSGDKNDKKNPSGETVEDLKINLSFSLQEKVKLYFSADDGVFLFQTEDDKVFVIKCNVESFYTTQINCQKLLETTTNKYDIKEIYYHKENLYVIATNRDNKKTELFAYNKKMELFIMGSGNTDKKVINNGSPIADVDVDIDIEIFADDVYIIAVMDEDTKNNKPAKVALFQFIVNHEKIKETKNFELIFKDNGVTHFKKSGVKFFGGQTKFAYIVNSHNKDFSIIKLFYAKVASGFPLIIHDKFGIRYAEGQKPTDDKSKIDVCLTLNSVFILNKGTNYMYGANIDAPDNSFIKVPLGDENDIAQKKKGRTVESIYCSPNHEAFQLIVKDDSKTDSDRYLITYFDFDGSQASKKMHSAVLLPHAKSSALTSSIFDKKNNFMLTLVYSFKQGIGTADPFLLNLNGPFISLCLNKYYYEVDFKEEIQPILEKEKKWNPAQIAAEKKKYSETPTLFRRKNILNLLKITFMTDDKNTVDTEIGFRLLKIEQTKGRFRELVSIPSSSPKNEKLSSYISSNGPIFEVRLRKPDSSKKPNDLKEAIEIKQKLEIINEGKTGVRKPWTYMDKSIILDAIGDIVLVHDVTNNKVILYRQISITRHIFDLKETDKYGIDCRNFNLISLGRTVYVNFICEKDLDTVLTISSFEIHEAVIEATFIKKLPFDVQELKFANNDDYIFIAMKELNGDGMRVWRIERKRGDLSEIKAKSRVPGDLSLFPYTVFDIISVKSVTALTVLSPGQNFFRVMTFDFQALSLVDTKQFYSKNRTAIYYQGFGKCEDDKPCIIGITGGDGVNIHEHEIPIDEKKKSIGDAKITQTFQKFFTGKSIVKEIIPLGEYYLITGHFGKMEVSEESVKENEVPKENKSETPPSPSPTPPKTRILPNLKSGKIMREIYHLIYKKGEPTLFMRGYGDDKHGSLQKDKDGYLYVASEDNAIKYYRIQDFTLTENPKVSRSGDDKKPKLILYSYTKANEPQIYLSVKDVSESFFYQTVAIIFIVGVIILCVITYRLAKKLDQNEKFKFQQDKVLFQMEEVDKNFTDQKIIDDYFGEKRRAIQGNRAAVGRITSVGYEEDKLGEERNLADAIADMKEDDEELVDNDDDDLGFLGNSKKGSIHIEASGDKVVASGKLGDVESDDSSSDN